ncbi:MAG: patatin-like phospholipase family protein [Chloroflexi bacterium]|nr:patatin-like phospholipase family protein [Chloroflexota bacterium]MBP7044959.1 patatin-like phospholipase family protein [Chloroflexota bacterium]
MTQYAFKNLIFQGGGIKSFAYHGLIAGLEEAGILSQIERVGGTSAGAMIAAVLSFRLSAADSLAVFRSLDYSKIPGLKTNVRMPSRLINANLGRDLAQNVDALNRLMRHYGWYDTEYAYDWLQNTIANQLGNKEATFADFQAHGCRDLHVVVTNISQHRLEVFSAATTPDTAVCDALLLSQSIPLFFAAPQYDGRSLGQGDFYGDGGILSNYPIHLFDGPQYAANNPLYGNGINWETLGCRLCTPPDCPNAGRRPITNIATYLSNLFETWMESQVAMHERRPMDRRRTIDVSDCCVSTTDFHVQPLPADKTYQKLMLAGETAVREFLDSYTPPDQSVTDSFYTRLRRQLERLFNNRWPRRSKDK